MLSDKADLSNCFNLTGDKSSAREREDSYTEGEDDTLIGATSGINTTTLTDTNIPADLTGNHYVSADNIQSLTTTCASELSAKEDSPKIESHGAKSDSVETSVEENISSVLCCKQKIADVGISQNANITKSMDSLLSQSKACDDVNLNSKSSKPSTVKGVLHDLKPMQEKCVKEEITDLIQLAKPEAENPEGEHGSLNLHQKITAAGIGPLSPEKRNVVDVAGSREIPQKEALEGILCQWNLS